METTMDSLNRGDPKPIFEKYLQALQKGLFNQASQTTQEALQAGLLPETIYEEVFTPALRMVGDWWEAGQATVAQEHLATGITTYCRNLVYSKHSVALPVSLSVGKVLLTNIDGNHHTLGLNLLSDVFQWRGWEVFPLFCSLPEEEVAAATLLYQVDLVCLSVAVLSQVESAASTIKALRQSNWEGLIEVGGPAFIHHPEKALQTGADFYGQTAIDTVEKATQLLKARV
ncbi:MAG: B12-binding domain-containing protein [Chloroflexota bacterium]|nr:cobalamin B12-binding domain-containing protein [Chloroflexota bacterium]